MKVFSHFFGVFLLVFAGTAFAQLDNSPLYVNPGIFDDHNVGQYSYRPYIPNMNSGQLDNRPLPFGPEIFGDHYSGSYSYRRPMPVPRTSPWGPIYNTYSDVPSRSNNYNRPPAQPIPSRWGPMYNSYSEVPFMNGRYFPY